MPRYIAETEVYKLVEPMGTARVHCAQIDELPRADVAPKSEVEELLMRLTHAYEKVDIAEDEVERLEQDVTRLEQENEALKDSNEHLAVLLAEAKSEVAREIFEEIEKYLLAQEVETEQTRVKEVGDWILHNYLPRHFAELKKKYTEEKE